MAGAAVWGRRVKAWRASGVSAREFADGEDFAESTLRYWAWRIEKKKDAPSAPEPMRIVRVVREEALSSSTPKAAAPIVSIEIGAARVSVGAGFDRATLRDVLAVLRSLETERTS